MTAAVLQAARRAAKRVGRVPWVSELRFDLDGRLGRLRGGSDQERNWAVGIWTGNDALDLRPVPGRPQPAVEAGMVTDMDAGFVADPFLIRAGGAWWLFFEAWNNHARKGEIACATSTDAMEWRYVGRALREPYHLSYPLVLQQDGNFYLVPESHKAHSIRLYQAVDFPLRWRPARILVEGDWVDPSIFEARGLWWMFAALNSATGITRDLHLFWARALDGPWHPHPANPVTRGATGTRPAGRVVVDGERILRFGQVHTPAYGASVLAYRVTTLTPDRYAEEPVGRVPLLQGTGSGWNADGMHHLDPVRLEDGRWLACVDGWRTNV